ncbi:MAG: glycogen/starch/alpha-glucan family phosphorylase [Candidatus Omnitrophota bacterium]
MSKPKDIYGASPDLSKDGIKASVQDIRTYYLAKNANTATALDNFHALALAVRHRIVDRWMKTQTRYHQENKRRVYYLSMEFLIGRLLGNYMFNLGKEKDIEAAMRELDVNLEDVRDQELDAGLGNGGLGRLAACFLDSMATLGIPAHGYGIRYDYGIFNQKIKDGWQVELPDEWMRNGNPWEIPRPEYQVKVNFYGHIDPAAQFGARWVGAKSVLAMPYDTPIPGYKNDVVNTLRLWSARANDEFDFEYFNHGDYERAVAEKILSESISKVLYPNDNVNQGKELRLKQEYFFTAASIADIIRRHKTEKNDMHKLHEKVCIQLNDTHPTLAVIELMRVLIDQEGFDWEEAWGVTCRTFAYTNHTLMPEALECWTVDLMGLVLPRHLEIVFEINRRFLDEVTRKFPGDADRLRRMSIIQEGSPKKVRMAHVAIVGSFSINGVSALHTDLLKAQLFHDFYEMFPERFNNKTNGITPRRWLLKANPKLSDLITETIGDKWVTDLGDLERLLEYKDNKEFQRRWRAIKQANKTVLADYVSKTMDISINRNALFDVQVKRLHEYKRQFLFGLYVMSQYLQLKNNPHAFIQPRTFIIGGKAAPRLSYG